MEKIWNTLNFAAGAYSAQKKSPGIDYYGRITYTFMLNYKVVNGDYQNYLPMEASCYTKTWQVEQLISSSAIYESCTFEDTNAGETGVYIYDE